MNTYLKIAGISIAVCHPRGTIFWNKENGTDERYKPFLTKALKDPAVKIDIFKKNKLDFPKGKKIFDSKGLWSLYSYRSSLIISLSEPSRKSLPDELFLTQGDFGSWKIFYSSSLEEKGRSVLDYPVLEVIMMNLLSKKLGVLVHASGIISMNQGLIFCGNSGAGKSTLSQLWKKTSPKDILLTDDRAVLIKKKTGYTVYGTPWSGSANVYSSEKCRLKKIFFITHSKKNFAEKINSMEAAQALIKYASPAYWDQKGLEFAVSFCCDLCEKIECYRLGFVPDKTAVSFIKKILKNGPK